MCGLQKAMLKIVTDLAIKRSKTLLKPCFAVFPNISEKKIASFHFQNRNYGTVAFRRQENESTTAWIERLFHQGAPVEIIMVVGKILDTEQAQGNLFSDIQLMSFVTKH